MSLSRWLVVWCMGFVLGCGTPEPERIPSPTQPTAPSVDLLMSTLMHGEIEPCG